MKEGKEREGGAAGASRFIVISLRRCLLLGRDVGGGGKGEKATQGKARAAFPRKIKEGSCVYKDQTGIGEILPSG